MKIAILLIIYKFNIKIYWTKWPILKRVRSSKLQFKRSRLQFSILKIFLCRIRSGRGHLVVPYTAASVIRSNLVNMHLRLITRVKGCVRLINTGLVRVFVYFKYPIGRALRKYILISEKGSKEKVVKLASIEKEKQS